MARQYNGDPARLRDTEKDEHLDKLAKVDEVIEKTVEAVASQRARLQRVQARYEARRRAVR